MNFSFEEVEGFIFDFDGVLTDNKVYLNQYGVESVACSRADGLGFDVLKKINKPVWIFSTERNEVVLKRANKLRVAVINAISNKFDSLNKLAEKEALNLSNCVYVGNDLNDYHAMNLCGLKICPSDAHNDIKKISDVILEVEGGAGVVREILEKTFKLNFLEYLK